MQKLRYSVQHFQSSHTNFCLSARTVICQLKKILKSQFWIINRSYIIFVNIMQSILMLFFFPHYCLVKAFLWLAFTISSGDADLKSNGVMAIVGPVSLGFTSCTCLLYRKVLCIPTVRRLYPFGG